MTLATFMVLSATCVLLTSCPDDPEEPSKGNDVEQLGEDEPEKNTDTKEYVDLGLPSGTLWATCNVGAKSPEELGSLFAWGETKPKDEYSWETYKWCKGGQSNWLTKYCLYSDDGEVDGKKELDLEDDAAYVNWGPDWRMPSYEQLKELYENCNFVETELNGVAGYRIHSTTNRNYIFLPIHEFYWSRILFWGSYYYRYYSETAATLYYGSRYSGRWELSGHSRYLGGTVRPVRNK